MKGHVQQPLAQPASYVMLVVLAWTVAFYSGRYLPYLYTEAAAAWRLKIVMPILAAILVAPLFLMKKGGVSGFALLMLRSEKFGKKFLSAVMCLLGAVLISFFLSHTSIGFPIWLANLFARDTYSEPFEVAAINSFRGRNSTKEIELVDSLGHKAGNVRLPAEQVVPWSEHGVKKICLYGRTSFFGTIVTSVKVPQISHGSVNCALAGNEVM